MHVVFTPNSEPLSICTCIAGNDVHQSIGALFSTTASPSSPPPDSVGRGLSRACVVSPGEGGACRVRLIFLKKQLLFQCQVSTRAHTVETHHSLSLPLSYGDLCKMSCGSAFSPLGLAVLTRVLRWIYQFLFAEMVSELPGSLAHSCVAILLIVHLL